MLTARQAQDRGLAVNLLAPGAPTATDKDGNVFRVMTSFEETLVMVLAELALPMARNEEFADQAARAGVSREAQRRAAALLAETNKDAAS